nr:MAG TPA: hypothetical protein [Caudoviricetes sp.]
MARAFASVQKKPPPKSFPQTLKCTVENLFASVWSLIQSTVILF